MKDCLRASQVDCCGLFVLVQLERDKALCYSVHSRIMPPTLSQVLEHEAEFSGLIERADPPPQTKRPGAIRSVNVSMTHVGGLEASGIDASVSYRLP